MGRPTVDSPSAQAEYMPTGPDKVAECTDKGCRSIDRNTFLNSISDSDKQAFQNWEKSDRQPGEHFKLPGLSITDENKNNKLESKDSADKTGEISKEKKESRAEADSNDLFSDARSGGGLKDSKEGPDKTKENAKVDDKPKSEWDKKIEASGAFTVGQAKDAYSAAAAEKDGIAIIIGSKNTPGSQELLDKLPELQKENPNLKFMFVDKDAVAQKLAENPNDKSMQNWDKWIKDSQKDCSGQPIDLAFTSVQSLKADEKGNVGPDKVTSTHWTADINAGLKDQARYAADATGRNLANSNLKLDFTPPTQEKASEKAAEKQAEKQAEKTNTQVEKQADKSAAKEETPFLKEDKEAQVAKDAQAAKDSQAAKDAQVAIDAQAAKDVQAAKDAQVAKDAQAAKDKQKPESSEQQEAAKKLEQEQQLDRQKRIKEATDHKYSGNDIEEVKRLSKELGLPIVMEIGYEGTGRDNPCPPCRALNGAMDRGLGDDFKGRALVMKSGLGDLGGRIGQQIPGFNDSSSRPGEGGMVPYSTAGYVGTDGNIHTLGSGVRGFSGAESWKASMNNEINNVNKLFDKYRKNK